MPPFTERSCLPPGIWAMVWADFWERYAQFGCELRMDFMSTFQGFLQKDRDGETIGIVVIDLNSLMPDQ